MPARRKAPPKRKRRPKVEKGSTTRVVGEGRFVQRSDAPAVQGKSVKSVMLRVDAGFAEWVRNRAPQVGSITEVTRALHQQLTSLGSPVK